MRRALLLAAAAGLLASAPAGAEPRCAVLGQMAVSSWLEMLGMLSQPDPARLDPMIARLDHLTTIHAQLACDGAPLQAAFDCILDASEEGSPQERAKRCMSESGLAGE